jgi:hypothetical protein
MTTFECVSTFKVSDQQWTRILKIYLPMKEDISSHFKVNNLKGIFNGSI